MEIDTPISCYFVPQIWNGRNLYFVDYVFNSHIESGSFAVIYESMDVEDYEKRFDMYFRPDTIYLYDDECEELKLQTGELVYIREFKEIWEFNGTGWNLINNNILLHN
jgi:hypothetical protein